MSSRLSRTTLERQHAASLAHAREPRMLPKIVRSRRQSTEYISPGGRRPPLRAHHALRARRSGRPVTPVWRGSTPPARRSRRTRCPTKIPSGKAHHRRGEDPFKVERPSTAGLTAAGLLSRIVIAGPRLRAGASSSPNCGARRLGRPRGHQFFSPAASRLQRNAPARCRCVQNPSAQLARVGESNARQMPRSDKGTVASPLRFSSAIPPRHAGEEEEPWLQRGGALRKVQEQWSLLGQGSVEQTTMLAEPCCTY